MKCPKDGGDDCKCHKNDPTKKENEEIQETETKEDYPPVQKKRDRAMAEFGRGSLRAETNQQGTNGLVFQPAPAVKAVSMDTMNPQSLVYDSVLPVPDFWVYDGAQPTIGHSGHMKTDRMQTLPNKRVCEYDFMEWQRLGSKKGWMFEGKNLEEYGHDGEMYPTFTSDGWPSKIPKYYPVPRSEEKQEQALRDQPAIQTQNRARGIGATSRGGEGMAGGYQHVTEERLDSLPIPSSKYNWTGNNVYGTGRTDQSGNLGGGAGGYRSGYKSIYPSRPAFVGRSNAGRSVGNAKDLKSKNPPPNRPKPVLSKPNIR